MTVAAMAAGAYGADFSHALHVALQPECTSCHAKAATSTRLEDNLLPAAEVCKPCHEQARTIRQPSPVRLSKFDHAFHAKFGNVAPAIAAAIKGDTYLGDGASRAKHLHTKNACAACHQGIEASTAANGKAHHPPMADCLVCHNKIDPPFSCETCHGTDKALKTAQHTADYLDAHTRKSEKTGCASCHGKRFSCLGCH
ncbi:MAG: hypothetical protein JNK48_14375 [Bryobacterales bacterium]|nr:hypothetical protein [Bryobacterales bacterium]